MTTKTAIVKILDEVNAVIIGLEERDVKHFYDKFGIFTPNYFHKPQYKLGRWDGKARFFSKTGKTYVQLLEEIVPDIIAAGYKIKLIDNRKPFDVTIPDIDENYLSQFMHPQKGTPVILGKHQVEAVNTITKLNSGIIKGGTGAGKSIIAASLCRLYKEHCGFRCIVIVPTSDLVKQTRENIAHFGNAVGEYSGDVKDLDQDHVVSTWQALQNNPQIIGMFHVVIVDECHGTKSTVLREIVNDHGGNALVKIGLTGTIPKEPSDAMNVRISLGNLVYEIAAHQLMEAGWLAKLKLAILMLVENVQDKWQEFQLEHPDEVKKQKLTYTKFKNEMFPDYSAERSYLKAKQSRNEFIVDLVKDARAKRGNTFILVNGIPYGRKLANMIPNAYFIHGKDETEVRKQIYKLFETENDIVVVTSFQLASTGLDIPRIFNLFLIDAGNSFIRVIQSIGRGLRKAADKDTVWVYDICGDFKYAKGHCTKRKSYYKEEQYTFTFDQIDYENLDFTD